MEKGSQVWNLSVQVSHIGQSSFQEPVSTAMSTLPQFIMGSLYKEWNPVALISVN